jgi:threonine aldolase
MVHPYAQLQRLRELTAAHGMALHCDGARIWNAAVASRVGLAEYGALFDTLSVCLSKGLGAPVGSLVVTTAERAQAARVLRRRLGGGMRQAGILAAAGQYALTHHLERLADDHAHARLLAEACGVDPAGVATNIVPLRVADAPAFAASTSADGVLVSVVGPQRIRLVTSLAVDEEGIRHAVEVLRKRSGLLQSV